MSIEILPSHVAVLVPSARRAANYLQQFDFQIDKVEVQERKELAERPLFVSAIQGWSRSKGLNEVGSDAELSNTLSHACHKNGDSGRQKESFTTGRASLEHRLKTNHTKNQNLEPGLMYS